MMEIFKTILKTIAKVYKEAKNFKLLIQWSRGCGKTTINRLWHYMEKSPNKILLSNQCYRMALYGDSVDRIIIRIQKARKRRR